MIENLQSIINQKKDQMDMMNEIAPATSSEDNEVLKLIFQFIQKTSKQEMEMLNAIMDNQKIIVEKLNELGK